MKSEDQQKSNLQKNVDPEHGLFVHVLLNGLTASITFVVALFVILTNNELPLCSIFVYAYSSAIGGVILVTLVLLALLRSSFPITKQLSYLVWLGFLALITIKIAFQREYENCGRA